MRSQRSGKPLTAESTEASNGGRVGRAGAGSMIRWMKFNAVGAVGMTVQLGALAVLNRWMGGRYLLATALAIEVTVRASHCTGRLMALRRDSTGACPGKTFRTPNQGPHGAAA